MSLRLAIVQHGDYREALALLARGDPEPYYGMAYCVETLEAVLRGRDHRILCLQAAAYDEPHASGRVLGVPYPRIPLPVPGAGTLATELLGRRIVREIRRYRPTHLLLRTGDRPALHVLRECVASGVRVSALLANAFPQDGPRERALSQRIARLLNAPGVDFVGNHRAPATESMIACGLDPAKAVAWDYPARRLPEHNAEKTLDPDGPCRIVFAGSVIESKGVGDLIDAAVLLADEQRPIELVIIGDGADRERLERRAAALGGRVRFTGRLGNDAVFEHMRDATLVCVPSRRGYPEAQPLTLTEALCSRTPVVASDHPMLAQAFREGRGVCFFEAGNPSSLAEAARRAMASRERYAALSKSTADAFADVQVETTFADLVTRWAGSFGD